MALLPAILNQNFVDIQANTPEDLNCGNPTLWKDKLAKFRNFIPISQPINSVESTAVEMKALSSKNPLSLGSLASIGAISHLQEKDYGKALTPIISDVPTLKKAKDSQVVYNKNDFALELSKQYGPKLASNFVFAKEGPTGTFSRFFRKLPSQLTEVQMNQCILGMRHQLTVDVLEDAWEKFRNNDLENLTILKNLDRRSFDLTKSSILDLSQEELDRFIKGFENDQAVQFLIDKKKKPKSIKGAIYAHQLRKIQEHGTPNTREFSYAKAEALAKVAYSKPESLQDGQVLPMLKDDGEMYYAKLLRQIHYKGVHLLFYVPISKDSSNTLSILCRGTAGFESVRRDLSPGIGLEDLKACESEICSVFNEVKPDKVNVNGHSLGALDAQRVADFLINDCYENNKSLDSMQVFAFCSPKPTKKEGDQLAKKLKDHPLASKITYNYASRNFDPVTHAGEKCFPLIETGVKENRLIFTGGTFNPSKLKSYHTDLMFENGRVKNEPYVLLDEKSLAPIEQEFNEKMYKEVDGYLQIPENPSFLELEKLEKDMQTIQSHYDFTDTGIHHQYNDYLAPGQSFLLTILKIIQTALSYI